MPAAELDCEICGRRGDVIPCIHSEWCQNGRCLKCHISILGQTKYYATAYDIVLTCESCTAHGDCCVIDDDDVEELLEARAAAPRSQPASTTPEQQKRARHADDSPQRKRQKAAASQAEGLKDTAKAPRLPNPAGKVKSSPAVQQRQPQSSPAAPKTSQQQQQQPAKATPPKRPAAAAPAAVDGPPVKRPAVQPDAAALKQREATEQKHKAQGSAHGRASMQQQQQQVKAGAPESVQGVPAAAKGTATSGSQAAAALAIGQMRLHGSQPAGSGGSRSQSHSLNKQQPQQQRSGGGLGSQPAAASGKAGNEQQHEAKKPRHEANAAAQLASKAAAAKLAQRPPEFSGLGSHGKSQESSQQRPAARPAPLTNGGSMHNRQQQQQQPKAGPSPPHQRDTGRLPSGKGGAPRPAIPAKAATAEASKQLPASNAAGDKADSSQKASGPQQQQKGQPNGIQAADLDAMRRRAQERMKPSGTIAQPLAPGQRPAAAAAEGKALGGQQLHRPKPFSLGVIKVGDDQSEEFDEDNVIPEPPEPAPAPIQHQASLRATQPVRVRGNSQAQTNDWVGRASIELDDIVDLDIRITPEPGVPLPPLLQSLRAQQDSHIDGSLVTRAVMDRRAQKESGQGSDVEMMANFSKALVILKERAFGQGKQLHTLITKMVDTKKFLKLQSDSQSVFFGPVLKDRLAKEHSLELVDFTVVSFDKRDDLFDQVYNDRLATVYHLKPGEELPSCKTVQFIETQPGPGVTGGSGWNKNQTARKSNLKKESLHSVERPLSSALSGEVVDASATAVVAPTLVNAPPHLDDEPEDWLSGDLAYGGFGGTSGLGKTSGGLGMGMSAAATHRGDSGFMAHDDSHVAHVGFVGAGSGGLQPMGSIGLDTFPAGDGDVPPGVAAAKQQGFATTYEGMQQAAGGLDTSCLSDVVPRGVGISSVQLQPSGSIGMTPGTSPTTPDQQLPPTPPVSDLERQSTFAVHGLIPGLLHKNRAWPKHKLMPAVEGLCKWLREHRMERLKVYVDSTVISGDVRKAEALEMWMRSQGANVTLNQPGENITPQPGEVDLLVVSKQSVLSSGLEGASSSLIVNEHLLEGVHIVSEAFIEGLQTNNLHVRPEVLDKMTRHWQFFASGVNLLWDATLLQYSSSNELDRLVRALQKVAVGLGPCGGSYKAFVRIKGRECLQHMQHLDTWMKEGLIEDLPKEFISQSPKPDVPQVVRDASKAIFRKNSRNEPLRFMVVVVPDASHKLDVDDAHHVEVVLRAAANQKTVYAATLSDTIRFLDLLSA